MKTRSFSRLCFVSALIFGIMVVFASASPTIMDASSTIGGGKCCIGVSGNDSCSTYDSRCSGTIVVCLEWFLGPKQCGLLLGSSPTCGGASCPTYGDSKCKAPPS